MRLTTLQMQSQETLYGCQEKMLNSFCNRFRPCVGYEQDMLKFRSELQQCFLAWLSKLLRHLERERWVA